MVIFHCYVSSPEGMNSDIVGMKNQPHNNHNTDGNATGALPHNFFRNAVYYESMCYLWFGVILLQHLTIESV